MLSDRTENLWTIALPEKWLELRTEMSVSLHGNRGYVLVDGRFRWAAIQTFGTAPAIRRGDLETVLSGVPVLGAVPMVVLATAADRDRPAEQQRDRVGHAD